MIRKTNEKIIVCGNYIEHFQYEKPVYWGFQNIQKNKKRNEKRERSNLSINRARQKLYKIILSNVDENQKHKNLFLTLTFKKNVKDFKTANYEYKKFIQRFYTIFGKYKYIVVPEFQKRGAIHYHILLFNVPYIEKLNHKLSNLWKNGYTEVKAIKDIKNISAYVSKYIRKGFFDKRLGSNKAYFCSKSCIYPQEWKGEKDIDRFLQRNIILVSSSTYPSSKKGQITKKFYKLIK